MFLFGDDDENYQEQSLPSTAPARGESCMMPCQDAALHKFISQALILHHFTFATLSEPRLLNAATHCHTLRVFWQSHMKQACEWIRQHAHQRCTVQSFHDLSLMSSLVLQCFQMKLYQRSQRSRRKHHRSCLLARRKLPLG